MIVQYFTVWACQPKILKELGGLQNINCTRVTTVQEHLVTPPIRRGYSRQED